LKEDNTMNPLSPFTYYRRHKGQALMLVSLITALTLGVYTMVSLSDVLFENIRHSAHYLSRMSRLSTGETLGWFGRPGQTATSGALSPGIAAQMQTHPDVAAVIPENGLYISVPMGGMILVPMLGVTEEDLPVVMDACDLQLKEGRLPKPRAGEIALSEEYARALDLAIGDHVGYDINADYYPTVATELTLVGILESVPSDAGPRVRTGFVSYEYLDAHELYQPRSANWLIIPHRGSRVVVDEFASDLIEQSGESPSTHLQTFEDEMALLKELRQFADMINWFVDSLVAVAAALVVGMVHRIAIARRLPELGLLHAAGHQKRTLVRRLVLEIAAIACVGWTTGLLCAHAFSILLGITLFAPRGWTINLANSAPLLYTLPIPIVVIGWVSLSMTRTLMRLDSVAIVERGKLSMEEAGRKNQQKLRSEAGCSLHKPLSSWTFYLRHRRRSLLLLAAIGLMALGIALPGFLLTMFYDSLLPSILSYESHAAVVSPGYGYRTVDPGVVAQIKAHPTVAHVIPIKALSMVANVPVVGESPISIYAVREQDLPVLLDLYGLHLSRGELVQPRQNHIILSSALARNRDLSLGDAIGRPAHTRDGMPTEMTVVGLLESTSPTLVEREGYNIPPMPRWMGFASYEYVDGHERYTGTPTHMLVVPVKGRESEMEAWLAESIASPRARIVTLDSNYRGWRDMVQTVQATSAISMTILTVVAALGLAILNTIFVTQRRDEFGILHAVGHSRTALIGRTIKEGASVTVVAWLIGAAICIVVMLLAQATLYAPLGTSIDIANPTPWLFTLPIPIAVIGASAGTIGWTLSKLDPVSVIERR
jgi:ABC-type lipoprotein release transport system permease subunit